MKKILLFVLITLTTVFVSNAQETYSITSVQIKDPNSGSWSEPMDYSKLNLTRKYWGADGTLVSSTIYPLRDGIGAGRNNTERIIQNIKTTDNIFKTDYTLYAAFACLTYQGGNYGDWYLPSKYESNLLYLQKTLLGMSGMYWTSNDYASRDAYYQNFSTGSFVGQTKNYAAYNVRPIRSF